MFCYIGRKPQFIMPIITATESEYKEELELSPSFRLHYIFSMSYIDMHEFSFRVEKEEKTFWTSSRYTYWKISNIIWNCWRALNLEIRKIQISNESASANLLRSLVKKRNFSWLKALKLVHLKIVDVNIWFHISSIQFASLEIKLEDCLLKRSVETSLFIRTLRTLLVYASIV